MRGLGHISVVLLGAFFILGIGCEKSEIEPMFEKKKLSEIYGDGEVMTLKVKLPLSQDTLGIYDASEVLEDDSLNAEEAGFLRELWNGIKYKFYDTAMVFGFSNRIKYSFDYEFPELDSEYVKSVRVNKIFFALESCPESDRECVRREEKKPVTFKFLDKFFMNLSIAPATEELNIEGKEYFVTKDQFEDAEDKAFASRAKALESRRDENGFFEPDAFRNLNIAAFENDSSRFKNKEAARKLGRVFLLRLQRNLSKGQTLDLVKHFKSDRYDSVVNDFSLIGRNIYLELYSGEKKKEFFSILAAEMGSVENLGIESFEQCDLSKCASLNPNKSNLVPMLERSNRIRFDTFLSLKSVEKRDFRYNGFVELEVQLDLGI